MTRIRNAEVIKGRVIYVPYGDMESLRRLKKSGKRKTNNCCGMDRVHRAIARKGVGMRETIQLVMVGILG